MQHAAPAGSTPFPAINPPHAAANASERTPSVRLRSRRWSTRVIVNAPAWSSIDLGNPLLLATGPMTVGARLERFEQLVAIGFEQIDVGAPAASGADLAFVRRLIDEKRIPSHVAIVAHTSPHDGLIERTFDALHSAHRAIVHLHDSLDRSSQPVAAAPSPTNTIRSQAIDAAHRIRRLAAQRPGTVWTFAYSVQCFDTATLASLREICDAVVQTWRPTRTQKMIVNLPAIVEPATLDEFADRIEWMHRNLGWRDSIVLSVQPYGRHGAAGATEYAMRAGAQRIEGCVLESGAHAGKANLRECSMELASRGIDTGLDFAREAVVRHAPQQAG